MIQILYHRVEMAPTVFQEQFVTNTALTIPHHFFPSTYASEKDKWVEKSVFSMTYIFTQTGAHM